MSISTGLFTALQGLLVQQNALNVTAHNVANASTPGYSRQRPQLYAALPDYLPYGAIGRGVEIRGVERVVDEFLNGQIRDAVSGGGTQQVQLAAYTRLETFFNELSENDLSTAVNSFFGALHDLSADTESDATRILVVQQGLALSSMVNELYYSIRDFHQRLDDDADKLVTQTNELLDEVADLNVRIAQHEGDGRVSDNDLRDQRDAKLKELSELVGITVIEQPNGSVNVTTRGMPLVLYDHVFHLTTQLEVSDGLPSRQVVFEDEGMPLLATEGKLPGTIQVRDQVLRSFMDQLNQFAADLIYQVNRVHSQGVGQEGLTAVTSERTAVDKTATLDQLDMGFTPLPGSFEIRNGSFTINLVNSLTGQVNQYNVPVDLDGLNGDDTALDDGTANSLVSLINAALPAGTLQASTDAAGHFKLDSLNPSVYSFYFSDDTSGVMATLGVNTFFSGYDAATMGVSSAVSGAERLIASGKSLAGGDNTNLLELIALRDLPAANGGTQSFEDYYRGIIGRLGVEGGRANSRLEVYNDLVTGLENEREAVSGVSLDEEMTKMLQYQRAYQAAARVITSMDACIETLLGI